MAPRIGPDGGVPRGGPRWNGCLSSGLPARSSPLRLRFSSACSRLSPAVGRRDLPSAHDVSTVVRCPGDATRGELRRHHRRSHRPTLVTFVMAASSSSATAQRRSPDPRSPRVSTSGARSPAMVGPLLSLERSTRVVEEVRRSAREERMSSLGPEFVRLPGRARQIRAVNLQGHRHADLVHHSPNFLPLGRRPRGEGLERGSSTRVGFRCRGVERFGRLHARQSRRLVG